jgi:hypothetical protein
LVVFGVINDLIDSYVTKKIAAVGLDPAAVAPSPRYIPLNPPDLKNPRSLCNLVFIVSIGKSETSTTRPATPPD